MSSNLRVLAEFTLDAWLLSRVSQRASGSLVDGRTWERAICDLLRRPSISFRQGPGRTTLFGFRPASGIAHEIDAGATSSCGSIIVECKSQFSGVSKADAALFHEKTFDFYCERAEHIRHEHWWRVLVSSSPISENVRRFCLQLGLILCDPFMLPSPVVMQIAMQPNADSFLRETLLHEFVRLGEPAFAPLQQRWSFSPNSTDLRFKPKVLHTSEVRDLFWLQRELGSDILDLYERYRPGTLERRTASLHSRLRKSA